MHEQINSNTAHFHVLEKRNIVLCINHKSIKEEEEQEMSSLDNLFSTLHPNINK